MLEVDLLLELLVEVLGEEVHYELAPLGALELVVVDVLVVSLDGVFEVFADVSAVQVVVDLPHLLPEHGLAELHFAHDVAQGVDQVGEAIGQDETVEDQHDLVYPGGGGEHAGRDARHYHVVEAVDVSFVESCVEQIVAFYPVVPYVCVDLLGPYVVVDAGHEVADYDDPGEYHGYLEVSVASLRSIEDLAESVGQLGQLEQAE